MKITFFVLFAAILFSFACNDSDQGSRAASIPPKPALPSDAPTSRPDVRVAILPLVNASQRWVDQNELLRESFPVALGAILQSSTAVELTSRELIKQRMDALNITRNDSVPDKSLIELAGQLNVQYLISWEPDQDKDLNPFLRVRLISSKEKKIVYLNEFPSGANVALFITFLNLYRDALLPAAEDLLERIAPGAEFMPAHLAPQLAQQHAAEALQDVAFALSLQHPSKDRRELEAHAYALATVALLYDSNNTLAREAMAFGAYVNGLYGQSLATLQSMQKDNSLSTSARGLLSLLQGDPPPVNAPGGVVRDSVNAALLHAVQAKHYAHGWQSDTASSEHLHSIYFLRDAFSATGDSWIKKTDAAVGMGLPQIQTEVALIALGSPSHEPYRLNPREYLLGRGDLAERLAKAMNATREDQPTSSSVALRDVMRVRSIRMGLALAEEAWLSAWDFARVQPAEVEYAEEAFSYAAQAYPSSAAILTEKARFYDAIAPDPKKRSEALSAARAADPGYVPAAQMAAELRAPSIKPQERIPAFEQVRALSPFNADLILWTAKHVAQSGAYGRAITSRRIAENTSRSMTIPSGPTSGNSRTASAAPTSWHARPATTSMIAGVVPARAVTTVGSRGRCGADRGRGDRVVVLLRGPRKAGLGGGRS